MEENTMVEETTMTTVDDGIDEGYYYDDECEGGSTGKVLAAGLALGAGVTALAITGYKKLKAKKEAQPKKKTKKRLRWVEVPLDESDEVIDSEAEVISEEESEE